MRPVIFVELALSGLIPVLSIGSPNNIWTHTCGYYIILLLYYVAWIICCVRMNNEYITGALSYISVILPSFCAFTVIWIPLYLVRVIVFFHRDLWVCTQRNHSEVARAPLCLRWRHACISSDQFLAYNYIRDAHNSIDYNHSLSRVTHLPVPAISWYCR